MGGKNPFLGIAYIVVGGICIVLGVIFTVAHLFWPRYDFSSSLIMKYYLIMNFYLIMNYYFIMNYYLIMKIPTNILQKTR